MIRSFKDGRTEATFAGYRVKRFPVDIFKRACNKLLLLNAATFLDEWRSPPGNRLEILSGDRVGQNSICINDQFRICFRWTEAGSEEVEIADYH